jgi:hypothetical protein
MRFTATRVPRGAGAGAGGGGGIDLNATCPRSTTATAITCVVVRHAHRPAGLPGVGAPAAAQARPCRLTTRASIGTVCSAGPRSRRHSQRGATGEAGAGCGEHTGVPKRRGKVRVVPASAIPLTP